MKEIYIVLTHTGTLLSKIIKCYTKDEFSHVSIALDLELKEMYSFGRLNPYNPFWGGFVHENINAGTFRRFYRTKAKIYAIEVTDNQYENIKENILKIEKNKENYKFNVLGLFAVGFNKKIKKEQSFYCAEFVKYVLEKADVEISLPQMVKPEDFKKIESKKEVYRGLLVMYNKNIKRYVLQSITD